MTAASNLRARNYRIAEGSRHQVRCCASLCLSFCLDAGGRDPANRVAAHVCVLWTYVCVGWWWCLS
jgi:hypothetical protein